MEQLEQASGGDLVVQGIADLRDGRETVASLLVSIGRPRLLRAGWTCHRQSSTCPSIAFYQVFADEDSETAHARYNGYIRRLISFERAAERSPTQSTTAHEP